MENKYKTNSFKKLLDRLQEDSWQMELLISGFAIFGLFYAYTFVYNHQKIAYYNDSQLFYTFYIVLTIFIFILIFNLLLHVMLRGLWIGSLGLRYVSGDIDFDKLNYSKQFTNYLKRKVGSFDAYIGKLENICSIIFAITFLLIFYILAMFILGFMVYYFVKLTRGVQYNWMVKVGSIFFWIGAFLTFFDYITQGLLKKNKWVSKVYFPFYWVFSIFTLSFLYRPLVYNFLDNKYGKRVVLGLIPFYLLVFIAISLGYQKSNFITEFSTSYSNSNVANGRSYEDIIDNNDDTFIDLFAIQSKVINDPYVKIMVPLVDEIEGSLIKFSPNLKSEKDNRGLRSDFLVGMSIASNTINYDSLLKVYLNTFEEYYRFEIDSISYETDFVITNINNKFGFESYIGTQGLSEGKHIINFQKLKHKDTDSLISIRKIPFWYYKE